MRAKYSGLTTAAVAFGLCIGLAYSVAAADVKIGGIYSIEGIFSAVGGGERDGALLAVEQLN